MSQSGRYNSNVKNYKEFLTVIPATATSQEAARATYNLYRHSQKRSPWLGQATTTVINSDIPRSGSAQGVDVIVADDGCWIGHVEFLNDNVPNAKNPSDYIGGNVLPGNGSCDVLDLILDSPYYIDPAWFNANPTQRLETRWDGTIVPTENAARSWWSDSSQRSSQFAVFGNIPINSSYTRLMSNGDNATLPQSGNGGHGTMCASQAFGRTFGWAYNANKWVLNILGSSSIETATGFTIQKIFHQYKPNNTTYGSKDPTICSNSWSYRSQNNSATAGFGFHRSVSYPYSSRGTQPDFMKAIGPFTLGQMQGEMKDNNLTTAMGEAITAGVIYCCSAGNQNQKKVNKGHPDYNNYWTTDASLPLEDSFHAYGGYSILNTTNRRGFPQQGGKFTSGGSVIYPCIMVGALDDQFGNSKERKVDYSDCGETVDIFAGGDSTLAAGRGEGSYPRYDSTNSLPGSLVSGDIRFGGTSSATPVAAGLIATKLGQNRSWTWQDVKTWFINNVSTQSTDDFYNVSEVTQANSSSWLDYNNPQGAALRVLWDAPTSSSSPSVGSILEVSAVTFTVSQSSINFRPVRATDGTGDYSYSISPSLPTGLTLNIDTGFISGSVSSSQSATSYTVTVTDDGNATTSSKSFTITIVSFSATVASAKSFTLGTPITNFNLFTSVSGGRTPLVYSANSLPNGLSLNASSGVISGTPSETVSGRTVTASVTDANSIQITSSFTITVNAAITTSKQRYSIPVKHYLTLPNFSDPVTAEEMGRAGYQILRLTTKAHPWLTAGGNYDPLFDRVTYSSDGRYVDLVICDNGVWIGHTEFINRNTNIPNAIYPTYYVGGNVLPGNGYCDVLDLILDGPYYIDPEWFDADSSRKMTRWDGTIVPTETAARNWWKFSFQRSSKFAAFGAVVIPDSYTRLNSCGSNTERVGNFNAYHGTQCAAQAYGRTMGWAFNANKWTINQIGNSSCGFDNGFTVQKIFHQYKPINPVFGTRDPTISSNSWGFRATPSSSGFAIYRGTSYQYSNDATKPQFIRYVGDVGDGGRMKGEIVPSNISVAAGEMVAAGVITVVAAGNSSQKLVKNSHPDYNNYWTTDITKPLTESTHYAFGYYFYNTTNRRGFPQSAGMYTSGGQVVYPVIQVGALSSLYYYLKESKVNYSDMGEDIDCYAPGDGTFTADEDQAYPRWDNTYSQSMLLSYDTRFSGTSSACPTAAGMIAVKVGQNRGWTWQDVKSWLVTKVGQLNDTEFYDPGETIGGNSDGWADLLNPQGSVRRVIWDAPTTASTALETVLEISSKTLTQTQSGVNFRPVVAQGGSGNYTYSISPTLPSGLTFNTGNGFVQGSATNTLSATSYTVTVSDGLTSSSKTFSLTIVAFSITATGTKTFQQNVTITPFVIASITGGLSPFSYAITSNNLATGLSLNTETGTISGTPNTFFEIRTLDIKVTDSNGVSKTGSFDMIIEPEGPAPVRSISSTISNNTFTAGKDRASNTETVSVTNTGSVPITIQNIAVTTNGGVVATIDYTNWGSSSYQTINVNQTRSFTIRFTGNTVGNFNNSITIVAIDADDNTINITNNITDQTYSIIPNKISTTESGSVSFSIVTTNYGSGTLYWKNVGTTRAGDFDDPILNNDEVVLTGSVLITNNSGSFTLKLVKDFKTEGNETIIIELYTNQAFTDLLATSDTVTIIDSSTDPIPVYTISSNSEFIDEGDTVLFYFQTTLPDSQSTFYWTNEGTTQAADFTDNINSAQIDLSSFNNLVYRTVISNYTSESRETIKLALRSESITGPILATSIPVYVRDTSQTPTATYSLSGDVSTVDEGDTVYFTVTTTNLMDRTVLYWTTRGSIDREDFKDNRLEGSFKIVDNQGAFRRTLKSDIKTEGAETFTIELRKRSQYGPIVDEFTVTINDTSITPPEDPEPDPIIVPGQGTNLGKLNARVPIIIRLP